MTAIIELFRSAPWYVLTAWLIMMVAGMALTVNLGWIVYQDIIRINRQRGQ